MTTRAAISLTAALLAGCGAATGTLDEEDAGASAAADGAAHDAAPRSDAAVTRDSGPVPGHLLRFRLSFRSKFGASESLFVQQSSSSREGPAWLTVNRADGVALPIVGRCDLCDCPAPDEGMMCRSCPICGPPPDIVVALSGEGSALDFDWDCLLHPNGFCDTGELGICAAPPELIPDGSYTAVFCWSLEATGVGMGHTVGMTACDEVPFTIPDDDGIVEDAVCACG